MNEFNRELKPYGEYYWDFYDKLNKRIKAKVDYVLQIVMSVNRIPVKFFRHIENGIYEIRIESDGNIYRILCFFDANQQLVLLQGFQKKTQKVPRREFQRAIKLRSQYYQ